MGLSDWLQLHSGSEPEDGSIRSVGGYDHRLAVPVHCLCMAVSQRKVAIAENIKFTIVKEGELLYNEVQIHRTDTV